MAVQRQQFTTGGGFSSSASASKPSGTVEGELLIAQLAIDSVDVSTPESGWTLLHSDTNGPRCRVYYKVATASEASSYAWGLSGSGSWGIEIIRYSGQHATTPFDISVSSTYVYGYAHQLSATTVTGGAMLIGGIVTGTGSTSIATPSGMSEVVDNGGGRQHEFSDGIQATAGATGTKDWVTGSEVFGAAWLCAIRPEPGQFVSDTFTDTAGVALASHTGETGATWVKHGSLPAADCVISDANRVRGNSSGFGFYYASGIPASAEYDVTVVMRSITSIDSVDMGPAGRIDTAAGTGYLALHDHGDTEWQLWKVVAGSFTKIGSYSASVVNGTDYTVKLEIRDAAKKVYIDGVERISSADNAITAAGKAGIWAQQVASDSTGWHIGQISGDDLGGVLPQIARPASDVAPQNWTTHAGGTTNLYATLDETSPDDNDYIRSPLSPSGSNPQTIQMGPLTDPVSSAGHKVSYRFRKEAAGNAIALAVALMQGATQIATWTESAISTAWSTVTRTLTGGEADAITNYADLRVRFTATESAPSAPSYVGSGAAAFTATSGATLSPTVPAHNVGDIGVLVAHTSSNIDFTDAITGWTKIATTENNTTAQRVEIWWRVMDGTGTDNPTVAGIASTAVRGARVFVVRNVLAQAPTLARNNNAASATVAFPNATAAAAGSLSVLAYAYEDDPNLASTVTGFSAFSVNNSSLGNDAAIGADASRANPASGTVNGGNSTVSGGSFANSPSVALHFVFEPLTSTPARANVSFVELEVPAAATVTQVGSEAPMAWRVLAAVGKDAPQTFHTRAAVGKAAPQSWHVRTTVGKSAAGAGVPAMPKVSQGLPVEAVSESFFAGDLANDGDYNTAWRSYPLVPSVGTPASWALDISGLSSAERGRLILHWRNDHVTYDFWDNGGNVAYLQPRDYTVEANAGAGGGAAPGSGWVNLATVTANVYSSRQHDLGDCSGYNWIRLRFTASNGAAGNDDISVNVDIHSAVLDNADNILALGDSIAAEVFRSNVPGGGAWANGTIPQQVAALLPGRFPLIQNGGTGTKTTQWAYDNRAALVAGFTGKYAVLAYGTNDAAGAVSATDWYADLLALVDYLAGLGLTAIVPYLLKRTDNGAINTVVQSYNAKIATDLAADRPAVLIGPDFYAAVDGGTVTLRDGIHPTTAGTVVMQDMWADWLAATLYTAIGHGILWNVRDKVGNDAPAAWHTRSLVGRTAPQSWHTRALIGKDAPLIWAVRTSVGAAAASAWHVRALVGKDAPQLWHVLATVLSAVGADAPMAWNVRALVGRTAPQDWSARALVSKDAPLSWAVRVPVGSAAPQVWAIRTTVGAEALQRWHVRAIVGKSAPLAWHTRLAVGSTALERWNVRAAVGSPAPQLWAIRIPVGSPAPLAWAVRTSVGRSAPLAWHLRALVGANAPMEWDTLGALLSVGSSAPMAWQTRAAVGRTAPQTWHTRALVGSEAPQLWRILIPIGAPAPLGWAIRTPVGAPAPMGWAVRLIVGRSAPQEWRARALIGADAPVLWTTRAIVAAEAPIRWHTRIAVGVAAPMAWHARQVAGSAAAMLWNVAAAPYGPPGAGAWGGGTIIGVWDDGDAAGDAEPAIGIWREPEPVRR